MVYVWDYIFLFSSMVQETDIKIKCCCDVVQFGLLD